MDLVANAAGRCFAFEQAGTSVQREIYAPGALLRREFGRRIDQAEPVFCAPVDAVGAEWVFEARPQHLKTAADAQHGRTVVGGRLDRVVEPAGLHPPQVGNGALRTRQNHEVRSGEFLRCRHVINSHAAALQRREVVEIGDAWKTDHGGAQ